MAQNKRNIKKPPTYQFSNTQYEKLKRENERIQNRKPIFKMNRKTKIKIKALLVASALVLGGIKTAQAAHAQSTDFSPQLDKKLSIAIANDDAEITVDGQSFQIDSNSFVIVSSQDAFAFDENGNFLRGSIDNSDFTEIRSVSEEEMSNYNIYQVVSENGVNVRSTGSIEDDNIISTVAYQDYVLGISSSTNESGNDWISTLSVSGDTLYEGYICDRADLIKEIGDYDLIYDNVNNVLMKVDTSKDGNINLNLRTSPGKYDKMYIMKTIPNGSIVRLLNETSIEDNRTWYKVVYDLGDGNSIQGWVASDYLTPYFSQELPKNTPKENQSLVENTAINVKTNATGNVTGIDISSMSPSTLEKVLENGIPEAVSSPYGNFNTANLAGDVNFVYMKLGASPYGNGEFKPLNYNKYKEQVNVCEKLGVPYGFYYYSTCTTVEEANIELEHIQNKIEELRSTIDMGNNKLEIVIDIELSDKNDRQYQGNVEEQTLAKATLINGLQENGLSDNILIYGPARVMKSNSDQVIDLELLHEKLSNPDNVKFWLCRLANSNGQLPDSHEEDMSYVQNCGFEVVVTQSILDANLEGRIDINNMSLGHYQDLMESQNEITQNQIDEYDDER